MGRMGADLPVHLDRGRKYVGASGLKADHSLITSDQNFAVKGECDERLILLGLRYPSQRGDKVDCRQRGIAQR